MVLTVISLSMVGCDFFDLALMANDELTQSQSGLENTLVLPEGSIKEWTVGNHPTMASVMAGSNRVESGSVRSIAGEPYFDGITISDSASNTALQGALVPLSDRFGADFETYGRYFVIRELQLENGGQEEKMHYALSSGDQDLVLGGGQGLVLEWWYVEKSFSHNTPVTVVAGSDRSDSTLDLPTEMKLNVSEGWNLVVSAPEAGRGNPASFTSIGPDEVQDYSWSVIQNRPPDSDLLTR